MAPGQGGGVVDAVAHHGNLAVFGQGADHAFLAVRQNVGDDFIHTRLPPNGFGGALVVTGQHYYPDAHLLKLTDGAGAVLFDGIRNHNEPQQLLAASKEQGRLALSRERLGLCLERGRNRGLAAGKVQAAAKHRFTLQHGGQTVARQGGKVIKFRLGQLFVLHKSQHCLGQRVLASALQRSRQGQQFGFRRALGGQEVGDLRLALSDGAGLIQCNDLGAARSFQRGGGFKQNTVFWLPGHCPP